MTLTNEQIRNLLANKKLVEQVILARAAEKGDVIYGARAINAQLPATYEKHTEDYDIYTKYPSKSAKETAKELNSRFGGKLFYAKKAEHKGTYKVKSKFGKETVADYTKLEKEIPTVNKMGVKYADIDYLKSRVKKQLRIKENKFRRPKDKSSLQRIQAFEEKWRNF